MMNEVTTTSDNSKKNDSDRLSKISERCLEIISIFIWASILIKLLIFDFDIYLVNHFYPEFTYLLKYKLFGLLLFVLVMSLIFGRSKFLWAALDIIGYPILLLVWTLPKSLVRNWPLAIVFAPAIHSLFTTFSSSFIWASVSVLSAFVICIAHDTKLLIGPMILLVMYLIRHFIHDFRRAFRPSSVFANLAQVLRELKNKLTEEFFAEQLEKTRKLNPGTEEYEEKRLSNLHAFYFFTSFLSYLANKLKEIYESRKIDIYFICTLVYTFILTTVVFAFEYWGLYKISSDNFIVVQDCGFWSFLGFSFSTLMTTSTTFIIPATTVAQFLCTVELIATLLIVFIIATIILSVQRARYREDMKIVVEELEESQKILADKLDEEYQLSLMDLEEILITCSLKMVNTMRRLQGKEALLEPAKHDTQKEGDNDG